MHPFIERIQLETTLYLNYYRWDKCDAAIRRYTLHVCRASWEIYGALYRVERRRTLDIA